MLREKASSKAKSMRDEGGRWKWKTGKGRRDAVSICCDVFKQFAEPGRDISEAKSPTKTLLLFGKRYLKYRFPRHDSL